MSEKVVYLAVSNPRVERGARDMLSCKVCKNKTFIVVYTPDDYPMLQCPACGQHLGKMGWVSD